MKAKHRNVYDAMVLLSNGDVLVEEIRATTREEARTLMRQRRGLGRKTEVRLIHRRTERRTREEAQLDRMSSDPTWFVGRCA